MRCHACSRPIPRHAAYFAIERGRHRGSIFCSRQCAEHAVETDRSTK